MNGYVLIGGRSQRMGRSKTDLFLPRALAVARLVFDTVYAVQRAGGQAAGEVETIFEPSHVDEAPAFGVLRALEHAAGRCFIMAVDYPLLTAEVLRYLAERTQASPALLIAPRWDERVQILCAGYDGAVLGPRLAERIASGRLDLKGLAAGAESEILEEGVLRVRFEGEPLRNVNTPEEFQEAMRAT